MCAMSLTVPLGGNIDHTVVVALAAEVVRLASHCVVVPSVGKVDGYDLVVASSREGPSSVERIDVACRRLEGHRQQCYAE